MSSSFNPYQQWLGIRADDGPITYYHLLGVPLFEGNPQTLAEASVRRRAIVERHCGGPHAQLADRIAAEFDRATACLLNADSRASYEQRLRAKLNHLPPAVQTATPKQPPPIPKRGDIRQSKARVTGHSVVKPASQLLRTQRPAPRVSRSRATFVVVSALIGSVLTLCLALGVGYLIRRETLPVVTANSLPDLPTNEEPASEATVSQAPPPPVDKPAPAAESTKVPATEPEQDHTFPETLDPMPSPLAKHATTEPASPVDDDKAPPAVADVFDIVSAVDLPKRNDVEGVHLGDASAPNLEIELRNPKGNPREFAVSRQGDRWAIASRGHDAAGIVRQQSRLVLTWDPDASADVECLRNAVLLFRVGTAEKTQTLRSAVVRSPSAVDLSVKTTTIPLKVQLWGLDARNIGLEFLELMSSPDEPVFDPNDRRIIGNKTLRVILRNEAPKAALEFGLAATKGNLNLRIRPLMIDHNKKQKAWTKANVNAFFVQLSNQIDEANQGLAAAPGTAAEINASISAVRRQQSEIGRDVAATQIALLQQDLENLKAEVAQWKQDLPVFHAKRDALAPLAALGNAVHQKSRVRVRVFLAVEGREVDLIRFE